MPVRQLRRGKLRHSIDITRKTAGSSGGRLVESSSTVESGVPAKVTHLRGKLEDIKRGQDVPVEMVRFEIDHLSTLRRTDTIVYNLNEYEIVELIPDWTGQNFMSIVAKRDNAES